MRLWYLSHRRTAKAQARLVSPEPSLIAHIKSGSRRRVWPKNQMRSPSGLLRMRFWRLSLRRTIIAIISWVGSFNVILWSWLQVLVLNKCQRFDVLTLVKTKNYKYYVLSNLKSSEVCHCYIYLVITASGSMKYTFSSRKHPPAKITPSLHLKYSKHEENAGLVLKSTVLTWR